ncbi:hypothetical protein EVAR_18529_1 [Eumeta japonica]|uniref:Uncharacterized protein n=1 Tax=Eumeta variegata TaxID=151549 RepID=A0A4C1V2P5_EUMVA|nr:hypothetical protein EVAR_18529_1 [Eumeta japonica]
MVEHLHQDNINQQPPVKNSDHFYKSIIKGSVCVKATPVTDLISSQVDDQLSRNQPPNSKRAASKPSMTSIRKRVNPIPTRRVTQRLSETYGRIESVLDEQGNKRTGAALEPERIKARARAALSPPITTVNSHPTGAPPALPAP